MAIKCPLCNNAIYQSLKTKSKVKDTDNFETAQWYFCQCGCVFNTLEVDPKEVFTESYRKTFEEFKSIEERANYPLYVYGSFIEELTYGRKALDVGYCSPVAIRFLRDRGWLATGIDLIPFRIPWLNLKCIGCGKEYEEFWEVNPPGGYGRNQVVICTSCVKLDQFSEIRERLVDTGVATEKDIFESPVFKEVKKSSEYLYHTGDFLTFDFKESFDLILMSGFLQCVKEPFKAIRKAYDLLNPNGVLFISTPDTDLIKNDFFPNWGHWNAKENRQYYNERILREMLSKSGDDLKGGFVVKLVHRDTSHRFVSWNNIHLIAQKTERTACV